MKKQYTYLVKRKRDGKLFCTYGNFKVPGYRPGALFDFVSKDYPYGVQTPFGIVKNISNGLRYDSKRYNVIRQVAR